MGRKKNARAMREVRHARLRQGIQGTAAKPRLAVFRSAKNIYAQVIDDGRGHTLAAASSLDAEVKGQRDGKTKSEVSRLVGSAVAQRAKEKGVSTVVFDRGGYKHHGRVKALAEAAREGGLVF